MAPKRTLIGNALDVQDRLPIGSLTEANGFLFTYGLVPLDPTTGDVVGDTIEEQTRRILDNLRIILATREKTFDDIAMVQIFLSDITRDFDAFNAVYREYFPADPPTRYCVGAQLAPLSGPPMLVEMHVIATA